MVPAAGVGTAEIDRHSRVAFDRPLPGVSGDEFKERIGPHAAARRRPRVSFDRVDADRADLFEPFRADDGLRVLFDGYFVRVRAAAVPFFVRSHRVVLVRTRPERSTEGIGVGDVPAARRRGRSDRGPADDGAVTAFYFFFFAARQRRADA